MPGQRPSGVNAEGTAYRQVPPSLSSTRLRAAMRICWSPLRSSDRRSTTRSSLWSAPSGCLRSGNGRRFKSVGFGAAPDGCATPRLRVDRGRGRAYEHDIVIDRGAVRKRSKKPSKPYRDKFGHTPLSADEELPWGGPRMIIGTGAYGAPVDRLRHALGVAVPGGDHIGREAGRAHPRDIAVAQLA